MMPATVFISQYPSITHFSLLYDLLVYHSILPVKNLYVSYRYLRIVTLLYNVHVNNYSLFHIKSKCSSAAHYSF